MTNTTVMAVRENFLISVSPFTLNEQSRYQIKQAAIERGVEQRRMPDKVVDTCWQVPGAPARKSPVIKAIQKYRWEGQPKHHDNGKQTHVDLGCIERAGVIIFSICRRREGHGKPGESNIAVD